MHDLCLFDFHGSHYPLSHPSLSDLNVNPERNLLCDVMGKENGSFQAVTFLTGENRNHIYCISQGSLEKQLVGCVYVRVCICISLSSQRGIDLF